MKILGGSSRWLIADFTGNVLSRVILEPAPPEWLRHRIFRRNLQHLSHSGRAFRE